MNKYTPKERKTNLNLERTDIKVKQVLLFFKQIYTLTLGKRIQSHHIEIPQLLFTYKNKNPSCSYLKNREKIHSPRCMQYLVNIFPLVCVIFM